MWDFKLWNGFCADWTDEDKVFQRIIERGIKLDRLDVLLKAGTGFFQNQCHLSRQDPDRVSRGSALLLLRCSPTPTRIPSGCLFAEVVRFLLVKVLAKVILWQWRSTRWPLLLWPPSCRSYARPLLSADDDGAADKIRALRADWDNLTQLGPGFGYFPNGEKTILLVKGEHHGLAQEVFAGTDHGVHSNIWMQILGRLNRKWGVLYSIHWVPGWEVVHRIERTGCHCGDPTTCRIHRLCERNHVQVEIPHSNNKWTSGCFQDSWRRDQLQTSTRSHRTTIHVRLGWTKTADSASRSRRHGISSDLRYRLFWTWSIEASDQANRGSDFSHEWWHCYCWWFYWQWHAPFGWRAWPGWGISCPGCCTHRSASQCSFSM